MNLEIKGIDSLSWYHHVVVLGLGFFFLLWFIPFYEGLVGARNNLDSPNEKSRVLGMASIALYGELHINRIRRKWWCRKTDLSGRPREARDGEKAPSLMVYPAKSPGMALMLAPFFTFYKSYISKGEPTLFEATYFARLLGVILPTWLFSLLFYFVLLRILKTRYVLVTSYFVFLLGTMIYPYGLTLTSHSFAAGMLFFLFLVLVRPSRRPFERLMMSFLGGVALGLAFAAEYTAVLTGIFIAFVGLWRRPPVDLEGGNRRVSSSWWDSFWSFWRVRWHLWVTLAGSLLPVTVVLWYHKVAFGSYWATPYSFLLHTPFRVANSKGFFGYTAPRWGNLIGTLISSSYGLFFWTPFFLFFFVGLFWLWRYKSLRFLVGWFLALVGWWSFYSTLQFNPRGGWTVGPRYIANIVPFMMLVSAWAADRFYRRYGNRAVFFIATTAIWSILLYAPSGAYFPHLPDHSKMPLLEVIGVMVSQGLTPMNILGLSPGWATAIFFIVLLSICLYIAVAGFSGPNKKYAAATLIVLLLVIYSALFQFYPSNYNYYHRNYHYIEGLIPSQYRW